MSITILLQAADNPTLDDARAQLYSGRFDAAIALYKQLNAKDPTDGEAHYGLVRALLGAHRSPDAYAAADAALQQAASTPGAQTAAGLASFRKGELAQAEGFFRAALKIDPGYPASLQGLAGIFDVLSRAKSALALREKAYARAPMDPDLAMAHVASLKGPAHIAALEAIAARLQPDTEFAAYLRRHIANDKAVGDQKLRRLTSPYEATKIKMFIVRDGPHHARGVGLEMKFNGKNAKLMLDTGASGISISPKFAEKAGLESIGSESEVHGVGDQEAETSYRYVASEVSAGKVTFARYPVSAFRTAKDSDIDGLVGADVFSRFLVGIDFEAIELNLDPRPGAPAEPEEYADAIAVPDGFTRVFRIGNHLLLPTLLNEKVARLFLIDSGSSANIIDSEVGREVAKVYKDDLTTVRGVQGKVDKVNRANNVTMQFAGFKQRNGDLLAIDLTKNSDLMGVRIGGILGMPVLANFKLTIDYASGSIRMDFLAANRNVSKAK